MIKKLPEWVLTNLHPAINDVESVTVIEMVARLYGRMQEVITEINDFTSINSLKVADPIQWTNTRAYEPFTVVTNDDGDVIRAYMSKTEVPEGTSLSNENYWVEIGIIMSNEALAEALEILKQEIETGLLEEIHRVETELNDKIDNTELELQEGLEDIENKLPKSNHNRMTYYIDGVSGSDDNDGLTQQTAFKTFDRFMKQADTYTSLHGRIISSGTYTYSNTEIANLDVDVQAMVDGVTLMLTPDPSDNRFTFYNGRMNFYGAYGASIPTVIRIAGDGIIYMVGCTSAIHDINFVNSLCVYGGECWLENVTIKTLRTRNSYARLYNCVINNDDASLSALRLLNGITIIMNYTRVTPLNEVSEVGTALITCVGGQISINPSGLILTEQTNYYYGLEGTSCTVVVPDNVLTALTNYSANGLKYNSVNVPTLTSN